MSATAIISKLRLMSSSSQWVRDCSFQHLRAQQAAALKHAEEAGALRQPSAVNPVNRSWVQI